MGRLRAPVQTAPDGRRFKPLAAVLCLDLDGRLNVNAHSSIAQITSPTNYLTTNYPISIAATPQPANFYYAGYNSGSAANFQRGQGYGPAEINLNAMFSRRAPGVFGAVAMAARRTVQRTQCVVRVSHFDYKRKSFESSRPWDSQLHARGDGVDRAYPGFTQVYDALSAIKQADFPVGRRSR